MNKLYYAFSYLRLKISQKFSDRRVVLKLVEPNRLDRRSVPDETVSIFSTYRSIPEQITGQIHDLLGAEYLAEVRDLFLSPSTRLAVLTVDGQFGAISWLHQASDIPNWKIPLDDLDWIFSRGFTVPEFRGRGCYARCIAQSVDHVGLPEARFFADCHVYNEASIRQFIRSGFQIVPATQD